MIQTLPLHFSAIHTAGIDYLLIYGAPATLDEGSAISKKAENRRQRERRSN